MAQFWVDWSHGKAMLRDTQREAFARVARILVILGSRSE